MYRVPHSLDVWILALAPLVFAGVAIAQTEDDMLRYVESHRPQMEAGTLAPLDFYKELHRRIAIIPAVSYRFKAENLKMIGERIDWYEDVKAGKITAEKAERLIVEQQAVFDTQDAEREANAVKREVQRQQQLRREYAAQEAEEQRQRANLESQRRAAITNQIERNQANANQQYQQQLQQIQNNRPTVCNTTRYGNQSQTTCR